MVVPIELSDDEVALIKQATNQNDAAAAVLRWTPKTGRSDKV